MLASALLCHAAVLLCGHMARRRRFLGAGMVLLAMAPVLYVQILATGLLIGSFQWMPTLAKVAVVLTGIGLLPWTVALVGYHTLVMIAAPHPLRTFAVPATKFFLGLTLSEHDAEIVYSSAVQPSPTPLKK